MMSRPFGVGSALRGAMAEDPESRLPDSDPNLQALESIDAVHAADPDLLNEQVASLRRFVRIRRVLYYSILTPLGALSRFSTLLVLVTAAIALIGALVALITGAPLVVIGLLMYWGLAALLYHALSVRLARLMGEAATSVGLTSRELLSMWTS